jgi:hypothetical protein
MTNTPHAHAHERRRLIDYEQLKNRDVLVLDGTIERLSTALHAYLAAQKELYYSREMSFGAREAHIEALYHHQQMIDHLWRMTLEVADTQLGSMIRRNYSPPKGGAR